MQAEAPRPALTAALALGEVVDLSTLDHRTLQWLAYESDGHPLAEDAYEELDRQWKANPPTTLTVVAAPTAFARIAG